MSQILEDLKAEVARQGTVNASAIALIKGFGDKLEAAINQSNDDEDDQSLHNLLEEVREHSDVLAAAVTEGTQGGGANPQSGAAGPAEGGGGGPTPEAANAGGPSSSGS